MIIRKKRKTRLINGGDGIDHSESFEKSAPGFHSSGYSYSSSTTKTFATPAYTQQLAQQEEDNERNELAKQRGATVGRAGVLIGAGAAAGYAGRKVAGKLMENNAQSVYNNSMSNIQGNQEAALQARKNKGWFKRLFGPSEKTINAKAGAESLQAAHTRDAGLAKAKGGAGKWAMIGAGTVAAGMAAKNYWRNRQAQQQQNSQY